MCGIAGFISLNDQTLANGEKVLKCMGELLAHRGPDGEGTWMDDIGKVGLAHQLTLFDHRSEFCGGSAHEGQGRYDHYFERRDLQLP